MDLCRRLTGRLPYGPADCNQAELAIGLMFPTLGLCLLTGSTTSSFPSRNREFGVIETHKQLKEEVLKGLSNERIYDSIALPPFSATEVYQAHE